MGTVAEAKAEFERPLSSLEVEVYNSIENQKAETSTASASVLKDIGSGASGFVRKFIASAIKENEEKLEKLICDNLDYCNLVETDQYKAAIEIADIIVTAKITLLTALPIPVLRLSVLMIRSKILDPLCKCKSGGGVSGDASPNFK